MAKLIVVFASISLWFVSISCSKKSNPTGPQVTPTSEKAWTFMLYDDADFSNAYDPLGNFSSLVSSDSNVNYLVLRDGNKSGAAYHEIGTDHVDTVLQDLGEVNMGSEKTLADFVNYAKTNFPAQRYIVAFYDHGGGWQGACWDMTSDDDNLTPAEMNSAFAAAGGVDIVLFTAPCLMGSVEAAYQLRGTTHYSIGSEDVSGFVYWLGMLAQFDSTLKCNLSRSTEDLVIDIISLHDRYKDAYGYGYEMTMSAVKSSMIGNVVTAFDKVTGYYTNHPDNFRTASRSDVKTYARDYSDLFGLLTALYQSDSNSNSRAVLSDAMSAFNACVIAEAHGDSEEGSYGLNIYYPYNASGSEFYYSPYGIGLDFKDDCGWADLVGSSLGKNVAGLQTGPPGYIHKLDGKIPHLKPSEDR